MKKILLGLCAIVAVAFAASADKYAHDASVLPEAAQAVLKKNCKAKVSVVKIDKEFGRVSEYEVVLTDGSEITFDSKGNWKDVEVSNNSKVPGGFLVKGISEYVSKNHSGTHIVGVERERGGYEVTLSNGVDFKFDKSGTFMRYD